MKTYCINGAEFGFSILDSEAALQNWEAYHASDEPGCMVTLFNPGHSAVEFRWISPQVHFEEARDNSLAMYLEAVPVDSLVRCLVSGRCWEPGCPDYGQRVSSEVIISAPALRHD